MNIIFRTVWNRTLGRLVVASEAARSRGKATVSKKLIGAIVGGAIALPLSTVAIGALTSFVDLEDEVTLGTTNTNLVVAEEIAGDPLNSVPQKVSVTLADDITLDSVTTGATKVDSTGVSVGTDVTLGTTGLAITGGPTITKTSIDAAGLVISNVGPGQVGTDAVNLNQLNDVAAASTVVKAGTNVAGVAKSTDAQGQDIYTVNAKGAKVSAGSSDVTVSSVGPDSDNVTDYQVDLASSTKADIAREPLINSMSSSHSTQRSKFRASAVVF